MIFSNKLAASKTAHNTDEVMPIDVEESVIHGKHLTHIDWGPQAISGVVVTFRVAISLHPCALRKQTHPTAPCKLSKGRQKHNSPKPITTAIKAIILRILGVQVGVWGLSWNLKASLCLVGDSRSVCAGLAKYVAASIGVRMGS